MFKFLRIAAGAACLSAMAATAAVWSIDDVNARLEEAIKPLQNEHTSLVGRFTDLAVNELRVLRLAGLINYEKRGQYNQLKLTFEPIRYDFSTDGTTPQVDVAAQLEMDLLKSFKQAWLNDMAAEAPAIIEDFAKSFTEQYGDAVTIESGLDEMLKDENGDVQSVRLHLGATIDLSKLPEKVSRDRVELTKLQIAFSINRMGGSISAHVDVNPEYYAFNKDQAGLKEFIEKLLAQDKDVYEGLFKMMSMLDSIGDQLVNQKPE